MHGGLTAMIIDEALGALVYMLKREAVLGPGPAFTAHLEVDYKKVCYRPSAPGWPLAAPRAFARFATAFCPKPSAAARVRLCCCCCIEYHVQLLCTVTLVCRNRHLLFWMQQPVPAGSTVVCTTSLESVDGRKMWVGAQLCDRLDGELYASARALFVVPRRAMPELAGEFKLPAMAST